jgi:hypothetical protein
MLALSSSQPLRPPRTWTNLPARSTAMMSLAINLPRSCKRRGGNRAARGRNMPLVRRKSARVRARRSDSRKSELSRETRLSGQRGQRQTSRMKPRWSSRLVNPQRKKSNEEAGGEGGSRPHVVARIQLHPSRLGSVGSVACLARLGEGRPRGPWRLVPKDWAATNRRSNSGPQQHRYSITDAQAVLLRFSHLGMAAMSVIAVARSREYVRMLAMAPDPLDAYGRVMLAKTCCSASCSCWPLPTDTGSCVSLMEWAGR